MRPLTLTSIALTAVMLLADHVNAGTSPLVGRPGRDYADGGAAVDACSAERRRCP